MKVNNKGFSLTTNILLIIASVIILIFIFITYRGIVKKIDGISTGTCTTETCSGMDEGSKKSRQEVTFKNNVTNIKEAAINYFTNSRLPSHVGDKVTLTLKEMIDKKLVFDVYDENGVMCDSSKSYVEVTKDTDEYIMKIYLSCKDKQDYILVHLGCYDYCSSTICEREEKYEYEYAKEISCKYSDWSEWSAWQKEKVTPTNLRKVETKKETSTQHGEDVIDATKKVTYSCKDGYTYKNGECYRIVTKTYTTDPTIGITYTCPSDYKLVNGKCEKTVTTEERIAATENVSYTCPSGYTLSGTKCTKSSTTVIDATATTKYSCPSGYTLDGKKCKKTTTDTIDATATTTYSCPSGYTLSGKKCKKSSTSTIDATPTYGTKTTQETYSCKKEVCTTKTVRDCSAGPCRSVPQTSCEYVTTTCTRDVTTQYITGYTCPSGYTLSGTKCSKTSTTTIDATATTKYSCPSGYTLDGKKCKKTTTSTIDATATTTYSCPSGYRLDGKKCYSTSTDTIDATKKITYTCPSGYTLSGKQCVRTVTKKVYTDPTKVETKICKSGYTLKNNKCVKTEQVFEYSDVITTTKYTCPSNYKLDGTKCRKTSDITVTTIYYRYATRTCDGGYTDKVWSYKNDKDLLNKGYKLTGNKRVVSEVEEEEGESLK